MPVLRLRSVSHVDNGLGMEAVAITCCELGIEWFTRRDEDPDTVTIGWDDFARFAEVFRAMRTLGMSP